MNRDLAMSNSLLYKTTNDRQLLFNENKLNIVPFFQGKQTADVAVTYSKISNKCVENSGFPNFMEVT